MKYLLFIPALVFLQLVLSFTDTNKKTETEANTEAGAATAWEVDFLDEFDTFNPKNWQDQRIWVNNETQCYVPDNEFETREVSDGTIKLKVVNAGEKR
ncbi:MAG: hypothetical protein ACJAWN_002617, partial [Neolewinella sp.]